MILLVAEHEKTHNALVPLITAKGYEAVPAECGEEAFHYLKTLTPRLVILDCGVPDSFEILARIRQEKAARETPVVMFSRNDEEVKERAYQLGANSFVPKGSLDWAALLDEIVHFVGEPPTPHEP